MDQEVTVTAYLFYCFSHTCMLSALKEVGFEVDVIMYADASIMKRLPNKKGHLQNYSSSTIFPPLIKVVQGKGTTEIEF